MRFAGKFRSAALSTFSLVPALLISNRSTCKEDDTPTSAEGKKLNQDVAMYLTPASRSELEAYLKNLGVTDVDTARVVVRRSCNSSDSYFYEPLFGEKAAFRLKGIVKTESGSMAGTGRVSTLTGELIDDDCDASIALKNAASSSDDTMFCHAIDLPTRLSEINIAEKDWKGEIPSGKVLKVQYPIDVAHFTAIPLEKQLVVAGVLCSSLYVDKDGNCTFDRSTDMQQSGAPMPSDEDNVSSPQRAARRNKRKVVKKDTEPVDEKECPVCRYMKGGPCKAEFMRWEDCLESLGEEDYLTKCFDVTMEMMKCMRGNEYYDIMTAGTADKYDAAEGAAAGTSVVNAASSAAD